MAKKCKYCALQREFTARYGEQKVATKWWFRQKLCAGKDFIESHFGLIVHRSSKNHAVMSVGAHFRTLCLLMKVGYICAKSVGRRTVIDPRHVK